jgi:hypothetical protein
MRLSRRFRRSPLFVRNTRAVGVSIRRQCTQDEQVANENL